MKTNRKPDGLRAHAAFVVVMILLSIFSLFSCSSCDDPYEPPPVVLVKPAVIIKDVISVDTTNAVIAASVIPNEKDTYISFEIKKKTSVDWEVILLSETYSGQSSIDLSYDLSDLQKNTVYVFRIKASNEAGDTISDIKEFFTYAVADYDGNLYHAVTIGTQTWLRENLEATHYANGDPIPNIIDPDAWETLTVGNYCYYNNDPELGEVYGALYNHYAAVDPRGFIVGWHTPTTYEFVTLDNFLGHYWLSGPALMEAGLAHWISPAIPGNNSTGFTALPNGGFAHDPITLKFVFMNLREDAIWWSATTVGPLDAYLVDIDHHNSWLAIGGYYPRNIAAGIRLLKN
ncbi:MAG: FISUMP domain-containing protein [Patescibacteria group bacterium]|jgi:uncharacterized protein (TIGR02145 family)